MKKASTITNEQTIGLQGSYLFSSIQENLFVDGKAFSYEDYLEFDSDERKIIVLDSSAYSGENLVFLPLVFDATRGPITIDLYTEVEANDDGTLLYSSNRREGYPSAKSILRLNTTGFSGKRFAGDLVPATGVNKPTAKGSSNESNVLGLPFELIASKKHALAITNHNGAGTLVQIKMTWFEA